MTLEDIKSTLEEMYRQLIGESTPEIRELERQLREIEAQQEVNEFEIEQQKRNLK